MLTSDQEKALVAMVDAAAGALYALKGAKCFCRGEFVCTRHLAERELAGAVDAVERSFVGEPKPLRPTSGLSWDDMGNCWRVNYYGAEATKAKLFAEASAELAPFTRWAWTDEHGNLHEVKRGAK